MRSQTQTEATPAQVPSLTLAQPGLLRRKGAPSDSAAELIEPSKQPLVSQLPLAQAKLTIGQPNDRYEEEANRVADLVMGMPEPQVQQGEGEPRSAQFRLLVEQITPLVQRQEKEEKEKEELEPGLIQGKPLGGQITPLVQRQGEEEEREKKEEEGGGPVLLKSAPGQVPRVTPKLEAQINALRGGGQPLDPATRAFMEPRFGHDFSKVRVHTNGWATETTKALNAKAFAMGQDVIFGRGEYQPETGTGKRLLAHELTHVVQQSATKHASRICCAEKAGKRRILGDDPLTKGVSQKSSPETIQKTIQKVEMALDSESMSSTRRKNLKGWLKVAKRGFRFRAILSVWDWVTGLFEDYATWKRARAAGRTFGEQVEYELRDAGPFLFTPFGMIENPYHPGGS